jgi:hypothetical protein
MAGVYNQGFKKTGRGERPEAGRHSLRRRQFAAGPAEE